MLMLMCLWFLFILCEQAAEWVVMILVEHVLCTLYKPCSLERDTFSSEWQQPFGVYHDLNLLKYWNIAH